jgi:hypothetical protein
MRRRSSLRQWILSPASGPVDLRSFGRFLATTQRVASCAWARASMLSRAPIRRDEWSRAMVRFAAFAVMSACVVASSAANSADAFWRSPDAYLGESPPSDTPKIFAPGRLVEAGAFTSGRVAFSKDGREFYYTQNDSWNSDQHAKLLTMRFADHRWRGPSVVAARMMVPTLSIDGKTLYMRRGGMKNVWRAQRVKGGWSAPVAFLEPPIGVYDFMPTASGNFYAASDPDEADRKNGISYSYSLLTISGGDIKAKSLGLPLNEPGFNGDFFIAPDESYMIVSANETKDYESELYISFRDAAHRWSQPVSLGAKINEGLAHRWGQYVTPDGKYLFYSHATSEKDCAVHWVRFDGLLASLRPKPR